MTGTWTQIMGLDPHELQLSLPLGEAVARYLKHAHPENTAKNVARRAGLDPRTVENILEHHLSGPTMTKLLLAYGWEFGAVVIAAVVGESYEDSISRELEGIAHERREIEERERRLRGSYARLHARRAVDRGGLRLVHPEELQPDRLDSRQG